MILDSWPSLSFSIEIRTDATANLSYLSCIYPVSRDFTDALGDQAHQEPHREVVEAETVRMSALSPFFTVFQHSWQSWFTVGTGSSMRSPPAKVPMLTIEGTELEPRSSGT